MPNLWPEFDEIGVDELKLKLSREFFDRSGVSNDRTWIQYDRGFPARLETSAREFLLFGEELLQHTPFLELSLSDAGGFGDALVNSGHLRRLRCLDLYPNVTNRDVDVLVNSASLQSLWVLKVEGDELDPRVFDLVSSSAHLDGLQQFRCTAPDLDDPIEQYTQYTYITGPSEPFNFRLPESGEQLERRFGYQRWLHHPSLFERFMGDVMKVHYDDEMIAPPPDWARAEIEAAGPGHLIFVPPLDIEKEGANDESGE